MKLRVYFKAFAGILGAAIVSSMLIAAVAPQSLEAKSATTIVLDPGHTPRTVKETDPVTGLETADFEGATGERQNMWETAQIIKSKLEAAGYKVVLTKNSADDTAGFVNKVKIANNSGAALAVSLHYDGTGTFGVLTSGAWGVTPQEVGQFRENKSNGKRATFNDAALAEKSQQYAQIIAEERNKVGDKTKVTELTHSFSRDRGNVSAWGNIPIVMLLGKVPWVYNETGGINFDKQKYAEGIANGIMRAVPLGTAGTVATTPAGCSPEDNVAEATPTKPGEKIPLGIARQIGNFYTFALGIGGLIALGVLVFGGILYTTSAGNISRQDDAKQWITGSLIGLMILFGSYFILSTINPELTRLKDLELIVNEMIEGNVQYSGCSATAQRVAEIATAEYNASIQEEPLGSNKGPKVSQYLDSVNAGPVNPWCAAFISWVFKEAGAPLSCASAAAKELLKCGPAVSYPAVGGIAVFRTDDSDFNNDHAGIITEVRSDGSYVVINGNGCDERGCHRVARDIVTSETTEKPIIVSVPGVTSSLSPTAGVRKGPKKTPAIGQEPGSFSEVPPEIVSGSRSQNRVILTFDGGDGAQSVQAVLAALDKHNIKSTFFLTGTWAERNPQLVKNISSAGHEIFNHTYTHPHLTQLSDEAIVTEFRRTNDLIKQLTGKTTKPYFRAPYGERDSRVLKVVASEGYRSVYWTIDALDWKEDQGITDAEVKTKILNNLKPGTIYLIHLGDNITGRILDSVITEIKSRGYVIVPLTGGL